MSEQKYLKLFIQNWWKYWLVSLLVGLALGYITTLQLTPKYQGVVLFTLKNTPNLQQKEAPFYLYDGYYSEQVTLVARNNLVNWLQSSKTVYDVYTTAGVTVPAKSAESLSTLFQVSNTNGTTGANTVNLIVTSGAKQDSKQLSQAVIDYTKDHYLSNNTIISANSPLVLTVEPAKKIILLAVTLGITFGVFLVTLMTHYLKTTE